MEVDLWISHLMCSLMGVTSAVFVLGIHLQLFFHGTAETGVNHTMRIVRGTQNSSCRLKLKTICQNMSWGEPQSANRLIPCMFTTVPSLADNVQSCIWLVDSKCWSQLITSFVQWILNILSISRTGIGQKVKRPQTNEWHGLCFTKQKWNSR